MPRSRARSTGEPYFIHIADPGFPDPPWPGERRLGPFPTAEEATDQAINDMAHGHITQESLTGVFSESESLKRKDVLRARWEAHREVLATADPYEPPTFAAHEHRGGKSHIAPSAVARRAATARKKLLAHQALGIEDQRLTLERMLPEGVSINDMLGAAKNPEALVRLFAERP